MADQDLKTYSVELLISGTTETRTMTVHAENWQLDASGEGFADYSFWRDAKAIASFPASRVLYVMEAEAAEDATRREPALAGAVPADQAGWGTRRI